MTTWRYDLPSIKIEGWAIIVMCSDGYFSTVSDWGNYAYWWSHHGCNDFRSFVLRCNSDQMRCKLGPSKTLDYQATEKNLKSAVCEARRNKKMCAWDAREAWEAAKSVVNELELNDWFNAWAGDIDEYWELAVYKPSPDIMGFVNHILPRLKDAIRAEMAAEAIL